MKEMKRVLALVLCFVMLVGYLPAGALAAESETVLPAVEAVLGEGVSTWKPQEEQDATEPATEESVETATEAPEELGSFDSDAAQTPEEDAAVSEEDIADALIEAEAFVKELMDDNDPQSVVEKESRFFTWDYEKRSEANSKPYLYEWSYYNGVVFEGIDNLYDVTGEKEYSAYVEEYLDAMITDGALNSFAGYVDYHGADCYKTASLLLDYYALTGNEEYKTAADALYTHLQNAKAKYTSSDIGGNYYHTWKSVPAYHLWLDGLYMILPFMAEYAAAYDKDELDLIAARLAWVSGNMYDDQTGLFSHAINLNKAAYNNSGKFWGRAIGWYAAALVDVMDHMEGQNLADMKAQLKKLVDGMIPYQTEDGMWRQFVNVASSTKETSVTALMGYAIMKAVNEGWLAASYAEYANKAFVGICDYALDSEGLHYICHKGSTTSYADVTYGSYVNEGKGVGPFLMFYAEMEESIYGAPETVPVVTGLTVSGKDAYVVGDTFVNPTVVASYSNGTVAEVSEFTVTGAPDMTAAGTFTVTVEFGGKTAEYTVTVAELLPVSVELPNGDTLTAWGDGLTAISGVWDETNQYTDVFETSLSYGAYHVTLEGLAEGKTARLTMSVYGVKTENLVVYAVAEDGTRTEITPVTAKQNEEYPDYLDVTFEVAGSGTYACGTRFEGIPEDAVLQEITIAQAPAKVKYFVEQVNAEGILPLDITDLKVTATYANETETVTKDIFWNEFGQKEGYGLTVDMTVLGEQDVVISYTWGDVTKTVSYGITIYDKNVPSDNADVQIELTVPGVTAVSATVKTFETYVVNAVDVLMADYVAYDIVLTGYNQGESVSVTLPLPEGEGEAMVYHIPTDGMPPVQMQDVTDNGNGTVTFTTDHFSTYASGRAISSVTGSTTINNNNTADTPSDQNGVSQLTSGAYYRLYNTRAGAYLSGAASGAKLARAGNDPVYWYITHVSGNSYYVQLGGPNGPYLHIGESTAAVNSTANALTLQYNGSTWTLAQNNQWLNDHGGAFAGWREADAGSQWEFNLIASRTYTLDTDGMDPGAKYIIVGDTENIALNLANGTVGKRNVTVSNNQITVVGNVAQTEFYFDPNDTENGSPVYLLTQNGTNTVKHSGGKLSYVGTNDGEYDQGYWHVTTGSNGQYGVYDTNGNNWYLNYGVAWAADSVDRFSVSSNQQSVRLYKYEAPTSEGGDKITFTVTPGKIGLVEGRMTVLAPKVYMNDVETHDYEVVWSSSNSSVASVDSTGAVEAKTAGSVTVYAVLDEVNGISLSQPIRLEIPVTVVSKNVTEITSDTAAGVVYVDSTGITRTGSTLTVTYEGGVMLDVAVTLNMIRDQNNNPVDVSQVGVQENLKIVYGGMEYSPYTLRVVARPNEDHPDYPNPGSVAVTKNATDVSQFQNVGVAEIQLTAAGVPMKSNVDVLLVLDLSNSMARPVGGTDDNSCPTDFTQTKLYDLQESVNTFADILLKPTEDGTPISNTMSVVTFGGYDADYTEKQFTDRADVTNTVVRFTNNPTYVKHAVNDMILLRDTSYADNFRLSYDGGREFASNYGNTNYDQAFMQAAESIQEFQQRYEDNYGMTYAQSGRKMYVLFMTDGAPTHYNGHYYNRYRSSNVSDRPDQNSQWINQNGVISGYSYGKSVVGGSNTTAAGINDWYPYISQNALYWATKVDALPGVQEIISIGFDVANGGFGGMSFTGNHDLMNVLENLVENKSVRTYKADDAEGLKEVYRNLATEIVQAATESYFVDQMGGSFDIETRPHITKFVDEAPQYTVGLNPVPKITISVYDTYKSSQVGTVVNGNLVTGDMVGKTYGTPEVLETVYFDPTGTKAYSSAIDARADGLVNAVDENGKVLKDANDQIVQVTKYTGTNIWKDNGVIEGKYFYYNAGENAVTINEPGNSADPSSNGSTYTLEPETFRWNIGTIQEKKFVMSYYVALEGAAGGTANAGTYETNTYATLYYKNYLGHEVGKYVQTPVLAWDSMSVRYGFYLVDSQGRPVADRSTGTLAHNFANAARVTEVAPFDTIKLNSTGAVSLNLDTTKILPEGYKLYDPDAKYQVYIDSVGAGSGWDITTGEGKVESTYVTHYRGDEYTNKDSSTLSTEDGMISYSDTIVWFAVLWEPRAVPDVIVIDYGLPVDIDVMFNDMFGTRGSLLGISSMVNVPTAEKDGQTVSLLDTSMWKNVSSAAFGDTYDDATAVDDSLEFGDISIVDGLVRYTPRTMQMPTYDKFAYEALFNNTDATTGKPNQEYYYGSVTVIPATTIYYEDTYVEVDGNSEYRFFDLASYTRAAEYGGRQKGTDENGNAIEYAVNKDGEKIESATFKDANGSNVVYPIDKFGFALDANGNRMADNANAWGIDGATDSGKTQGQDRPGSLNNAQIDVNNIYGYDGAYENCSNHSLGSARKIHIEPGKYGTATFSFWGTGFDIVSMTTNKTGTMAVEVYEYGTDNYVASLAVDTYYGYDIGWRDVTYTYTENGWVQTDVGEPTNLNNVQSVPEGKTRNLPPNPAVGETATIAELHWVINKGKDNALYQVPVLEIEKLPYGHYTAVLTASYYESLDHTTDSGYDLYLDAIRIYDPAGTQYGTDDNADPQTGNLIDSVIQNAYKADTEAWPAYVELRNILIGENDFNGMVAGDQITGAMFIDQQSSSFFSVENYKNYGPNNELYLTEGQSIAFTLDFSNLTKIVEDTIVKPDGTTAVVENRKNIVADVQIGLKSANGSPVAVELSTYTRGDTDAEGAHSVRKSTAQITGTQSSTDRYYSIGKHVIRDSSCALSLKNNGGGILSVTNIKITFSEDPYSTSNGDIEEMIVVNKEDGDKILDILSLDAANKAGKAPAQQPDAELEVNVRKSTVAQGDTVVVKTTTSEDVAAVTVDGVKVEKFVQNTQTGKRSWTATVKAETAGNQKIEVVAYNAKGQVLETATVTLEVTEEKAGVVQSAVGNIVSRLFS